MLPEALVVSVEIMELIRQYIGVGNEIELLPAKSLLHLYIIVTETVLSGNLVALRKVVDPLILVEALVHIALAR